MKKTLQQQAASIKLLALDVDGILTDGRLYFGPHGEEMKVFYTPDGWGLKACRKQGIQVAIITGRQHPAIQARMNELDVDYVFQGQNKKLECLNTLLHSLQFSLSEVAYMGDDMPDLTCIKAAGLGISVPNAVSAVKEQADWITEKTGGFGAVREVCDLLLSTKTTPVMS